MAEMIEKKALLDYLKEIKEMLVSQGDPIIASVLNHAIACVEKQPVLDAVEVVRCKDCKHWQHMEDGNGDCTNGRFPIPGVADITMNAEEFCCLGERKSNGKE